MQYPQKQRKPYYAPYAERDERSTFNREQREPKKYMSAEETLLNFKAAYPSCKNVDVSNVADHMKAKKDEIGCALFDLIDFGFTWDKFQEGNLPAHSLIQYNELKTSLLSIMKVRPIDSYYFQPWYWGLTTVVTGDSTLLQLKTSFVKTINLSNRLYSWVSIHLLQEILKSMTQIDPTSLSETLSIEKKSVDNQQKL